MKNFDSTQVEFSNWALDGLGFFGESIIVCFRISPILTSIADDAGYSIQIFGLDLLLEGRVIYSRPTISIITDNSSSP